MFGMVWRGGDITLALTWEKNDGGFTVIKYM